MKINIERALDVNIQYLQMVSDSLHKSYDFRTGNRSEEIVFDEELVYNLYQKQLKSKEEIEKAKKLINFIENLEVNIMNYNFILTQDKGKIELEIGYRCKEIKENLNEYKEYLEILDNGFIVKVEFED